MIKSLAVHNVGNKINGESLNFSNDLVLLDDRLRIIFNKYFLSKFNSEEVFSFSHEFDLKMNEINLFVSEIFNNSELLFSQSKKIAKHLYNQNLHHKINAGDFYVVYFVGCDYNGEKVDAIGLFKIESKTVFLDVDFKDQNYFFSANEGIDLNKLDKGCLIYNVDKEVGYSILLLDNSSKGKESKYWKDDFLGLSKVNNEFTLTNRVLELTKNYVINNMVEEFDISNTEKIELLNKSIQYFKTKDQFESNEFQNEVFSKQDYIDSFEKFEKQILDEENFSIDSNFVISAQAVKKQSRVFKKVLKLDRNFDIYIHGDKNLIEKGVEKDGRKYYKIYYEVES